MFHEPSKIAGQRLFSSAWKSIERSATESERLVKIIAQMGSKWFGIRKSATNRRRCEYLWKWNMGPSSWRCRACNAVRNKNRIHMKGDLFGALWKDKESRATFAAQTQIDLKTSEKLQLFRANWLHNVRFVRPTQSRRFNSATIKIEMRVQITIEAKDVCGRLI